MHLLLMVYWKEVTPMLPLFIKLWPSGVLHQTTWALFPSTGLVQWLTYAILLCFDFPFSQESFIACRRRMRHQCTMMYSPTLDRHQVMPFLSSLRRASLVTLRGELPHGCSMVFASASPLVSFLATTMLSEVLHLLCPNLYLT